MKTKCIRYFVSPQLLGVVPFEQLEKRHVEEFKPELWTDMKWNGKKYQKSSRT